MKNENEVTALVATLEKCREITNCPAGVDLQDHLRQLAAENVGLKSAITDHSQSVHYCEVCGKDDPCSTDDVCYVLSETPATDRIYAGIKADAEKAALNDLLRHLDGIDIGNLPPQWTLYSEVVKFVNSRLLREVSK
ncbi:TPA: hypothetical protein OT047_003492 [Klebsiella pneumoniae]|nr:hypothetical protein [Klebsiella pneumoniae]